MDLLTTECVRQLGFPCAELCGMKKCYKYFGAGAENQSDIEDTINIYLAIGRHLLTSKGLGDGHTLYAST